MRWALVVMSLLAAPAVQAKDTQVEGVCKTLRQMAELASEAEASARAASDLGKTGLEGVNSDHPSVAEARAAEAKALTLANEAAALSRSLVHSGEELCPNWLNPS
jgi:hypothetical protein